MRIETITTSTTTTISDGMTRTPTTFSTASTAPSCYYNNNRRGASSSSCCSRSSSSHNFGLFRPLVARVVCCWLMIAHATPWTTSPCASFSRHPRGGGGSDSSSPSQQKKNFNWIPPPQQEQHSLLKKKSALFDSKISSSAASSCNEVVENAPAADTNMVQQQDTLLAVEDEALDSKMVEVSDDKQMRRQPPLADNEDDMDDKVEILAHDSEFEKPERDSRQYRLIRLKRNNLKVFLVSDQLAEGDVGVEAASVHVQAGHFDDTIPGLAHFHEHMLFLGTEKYPQEDEYETFLNQNGGGSSNAYTDMEDTNYFFSIITENKDSNQTSKGLAGALDRLAQFFIKPKFDPDAVDREVKAIDSEYRNGKTSDAWRNYQAVKSFANPNHPFAKFGCGNYETLTSLGTAKLLEELHKFWQTYYQSYNLRLAVVGHASLDALQQTVEETFGELPYSEGKPRYERTLPVVDKNDNDDSKSNPSSLVFVRENAAHGCPAFGPEHLGLIRYIIPLLEARSVKIYFASPPLEDPLLHDSKPYRVISHLLGHESPGSLHALLNEAGYLTGLSSGIAIDASDFCLFSVTISLTPHGMEHLDHVLDLTFQWIALIRQLRPNEELGPHHDELRRLSDIHFRFRENSDPTDFVSNAADFLFDNAAPIQTFLKGSTVQSDLDPVVTKAFLDRLRPQNALIVITNSDMKQHNVGSDNDNNNNNGTWKIEPWYGAPHMEKVMDPEQMKQWESPTNFDSRLHIPDLNAYIPDDFSLRCDEEEEVARKEDDEDGGDDADIDGEEEDDDEDDAMDEITIPPVPIVDNQRLRLWHKMDRYWRVPKAFIRLSILTPDVYRSPRSITYNRIFQRILNDDLNSFVYDASLAGCNYRVSCLPTGYRISVRGYSQKLSFLLDTLTSRIFSLIEEMKDGESSLLDKFNRARDGLCRETKNYRLDSPYEVANYNSRLMIEESVWYIDNYINEMEGSSVTGALPLTMEECAQVAEECLSQRIKCEALCMGNLATHEAMVVADLISKRFLSNSRVLSSVEFPSFRSLQLPTREEGGRIFGSETIQRSVPLIYADLAFSETEENNAVELILQCGSEFDLGYEGLATFDLVAHIAYNSAFNQLRTIEQLGYIVSVTSRKTAGNAWAMSILVQGSAVPPSTLEERIEAWLHGFGEELKAMSLENVVAEGQAVVAQLLEKETKLSQEVSRAWGEILNTEGITETMRTPAFDRLDRLCDELLVDEEENDDENDGNKGAKAGDPTITKSVDLTAQALKDRMVRFFDYRLNADSPHRRAMSARVYSHKWKNEFMEVRSAPGVVSSFEDLRHLKQFLSSWPTVPYWRIDNSTVTKQSEKGVDSTP
ncbi:hypothetical protein ACA910_015460 [Epithemia clementina (nom. ined.)]